ncbi:MAG: hypothetical protein ABR607_08880 [Pyrinomonadaceae bacterium]
MPQRKKSATGISLHEMIVTEWHRLGAVSIGTRELLRIQQAIGEAFGEYAVESPATIARELAHEGAELRHPEIIECDARWRQTQIDNQRKAFSPVSGLQNVERLRLKQAESLIKKLERLRAGFERKPDNRLLTELRNLSIEARQKAIYNSKDTSLPTARRHEQAEIAAWLMVWLETPGLFQQWVELRKSSTAFKERFATAAEELG